MSENAFAHPDRFVSRHLGPREGDVTSMLREIGASSVEDLVGRTVPASIRLGRALDLPPARSEREAMDDLAELASRNDVFRSYIGLGYHGTVTPPVIRRNVLENPGWYTQYTPYQAEISQGRLEAMLNFQTLVLDLTGLAVANASMLDEGTAAAEAMTLCHRVLDKQADGRVFFVADSCHPQTIEVVRERALPLAIDVVVGDPAAWDFSRPTFAVLVPYPTTDGAIVDWEPFASSAHAAGAMVVVVADLLALTVLREPAAFGADVCCGSAQRFGVPMGFGGPHAAFLAAKDAFKRQMPGRIVGVSKDSSGRPAYRLALQTREQHIRRDKATSNICTAQVLLAVMASMYAVWHGPEGLRAIAQNVHGAASALAAALEKLGHRIRHRAFFDTLRVAPQGRTQIQILKAAAAKRINLRAYDDGDLGIALDETVGAGDLADLVEIFGGRDAGIAPARAEIADAFRRRSGYLEHPVFHRHRSETEMLRYLKRLENRDLSLTASMIPLGSCTMKLNAAAEMFPISYPGFAQLHPFAPKDQTEGYRELFRRLEGQLAEITGFHAVSLQPNAGAQGEYAGLLVIRAYHHARGERDRDVCLIPVSAHGTNPASAAMAGFRVVAVACDAQGNVDVADLKAKLAQHGARIAALMVTYPSTHGVFEESIREICSAVHGAGGQVYLDGANLNALVGLARPADRGRPTH